MFVIHRTYLSTTSVRFFHFVVLPFVIYVYRVPLVQFSTCRSRRFCAQDFRQNRMIGLPKRTAKFQFIYSGFLVMSVLMPPVPMLRLSRMFFSP